MQDEISLLVSIVVVVCWSANKEDALRCEFLRKVHPKRCKGSTPGSNAEEISTANGTNGLAVSEATLPPPRNHFKTLQKLQAPSASKLEHVHRQTFAALLNFEATFDSPHHRRLLRALHENGVPGKVMTGVGAVVGKSLFNFAINDRIVSQCPADILAPSGCSLTDLEYDDDVVIFAESSMKLQHVVNLVSKLAAA
ncbi:hypothetical protein RB195_019349 [Necator americanus]|uniref:Reverse transcriptase domain-containing protein n=2 Tax=Necator americanus TaxID=51031 RepID=A0ABR1CDQ9_NECAM